MSSGAPSDQELQAVLRRSQRLGYIGGSDLEPHIRNARGFVDAVGEPPTRALDLGSGGGLPGLVLACDWPTSSWVLLDGSQTRTAFLEHAVQELDLGDRVTVVRGRAEEAAHDEEYRGAFDLVVARSFGPPAVVAECAAPFLLIGGSLVVSEPPDTAGRWDHPQELADLGLDVGIRTADAASRNPADDSRDDSGAGTFQELLQVTRCPDRFPRRVGVPTKRPLFGR